MKQQKVVTYSSCRECTWDINDNINRGWRVISMVSVPTDMTSHEVYCKIIVVYEECD